MQNNAPNNFQAYQFPQISNPPAQQSDLYTFAPAHNQNQQQQQLYYTAQTAHDQQGATDSSETAGPSQKKKVAAAKKHVVKEEPEEHTRADEPKKKRTKRSAGKACVYCRRSHMVCEGGRPCERCIKREIPHLCRDCTPPPHNHHSPHKQEPQQQQQQQQQQQSQQQLSLNQSQVLPSSSQQIPIYTDSNFVPSWPLLPDTSAAQITFSDAPSEQIQDSGDAGIMGPLSLGSSKDDGELAALSKFMKDLGVPDLPNDFLSFMNQLDKPDASNSLSIASSSDTHLFPSSGVSQGVGLNKGKDKLNQISRIDRYLMAAADQPNGTRASRLAQVIKAKYDAGLLKPYDYVKGYERMNKWMESGRAAPKMDSRAGSEAPEESPQRSTAPMRNGRLSITTAMSSSAPAFGKSISSESRRRILAALAGFRPKFRQIARTLTNVDLVFVEEAMERWMLEYDRAFASIHTPSCIWRRTGEIQKANQEFSNLTGIPAYMFRDGQLCVYELMDEDSAVRYWEGYGKIAFDPSQRAMSILCTLHIPLSLTRHRPQRLANTNPANVSKSATSGPPQAPYTPDLALPQQNMFNDGVGSDAGTVVGEEYREMRCAFSVTIRRDAWGVPVAIMGQWIPIQ
ncbi:transcriptional regulatory protein [Cryptococcus gattii Ru294]|uniref:Transcriptional regulatory protein, putative n=2 Tax=Cryptococcus gattii TaxID=37769 RepID=E6QZD7_CRYGW|nr:transcriptional regulatory protein, putative [Cryptococcus gattii WM276]KIR54252.1 transcriptional regulatory protein [Cryptococcus gattii Ru294]KIR80050.1 transcriptional regulatory protein [Cryptococcus gattii EJB2]KIY34307.1 transcriptional regulatory protein [Cryptococcus gattii E566]KJE05333.1 transcriptional regulatory protein [Cryptococcus gattii NT-10]ADV19468.1 transcriptional regulatory protein, putative [Cryptococcus gattii WM276]